MNQKFCLATGNRALIRGDYDQARACYCQALSEMPELGSVIEANMRLAEMRRFRATHGEGLKLLLERPAWSFEQILHWAMVWFRAVVAQADVKSVEDIDKASRQSYKGLYKIWVSSRFIGVTPEQFVNRPEGLPRCQDPLFNEGYGYKAHDLPLAGLLYGGFLGMFTKITSVAEPKDSQWLDPCHLTLALLTALEQTLETRDRAVIERLWRLPGKPSSWARAD